MPRFSNASMSRIKMIGIVCLYTTFDEEFINDLFLVLLYIREHDNTG